MGTILFVGDCPKSPSMWYLKFDTYVVNWICKIKISHYVYFTVENDRLHIVALYFDDMLLFGKGKGMILDFKSQLSA